MQFPQYHGYWDTILLQVDHDGDESFMVGWCPPIHCETEGTFIVLWIQTRWVLNFREILTNNLPVASLQSASEHDKKPFLHLARQSWVKVAGIQVFQFSWETENHSPSLSWRAVYSQWTISALFWTWIILLRLTLANTELLGQASQSSIGMSCD